MDDFEDDERAQRLEEIQAERAEDEAFKSRMISIFVETPLR